METCPKCQKELRWLPKGRHTCLCGEVIITDGEDLKDVEIAIINVPDRAKFPVGIKGPLCLAILSLLAIIGLGVYFMKM